MQATGNNQNQPYSLSIRLFAGGLSFFGYQPASGRIARETYPYVEGKDRIETLREALAQSSIARWEGNRLMTCVLTQSPAMQVPLECFRKEEAYALYRLTYSSGERNGKVYYNILPHLEIAQIFTIDNEVEKLLCQHLPGIRFYHSHTMILEKMWMLEKQGIRQLYAYFQEKEMFVFAYQEQRLAYANSFAADVTENAVYFLLSVWKSLEKDAHTDCCVLLGEHDIKHAVAQILAKYLAHVEEIHATDIYRRSTLAKDPQIPFDLLALWVNNII